MSSEQWKTEQGRIEEATQEAIKQGREILTPMGAACLFGKSLETIRKARRAEPDEAVAFVLGLEDRPVPMLRLQWATEKWGKDLNPYRLKEMRDRCHTLGVRRVIYLILHDRPLQGGSNIHGPAKWDEFEKAENEDRDTH